MPKRLEKKIGRHSAVETQTKTKRKVQKDREMETQRASKTETDRKTERQKDRKTERNIMCFFEFLTQTKK